MKIKKTIVLLLLCTAAMSQIHNKLLGYYTATSDSLLYKNFVFDGNGKVTIMEIFSEDFFVEKDSLFVFTDKSDVFRFAIHNNELHGADTLWLKGGVWKKQDTLISSNRKDEVLAQQQAELLSEYYHKTRKNKSMEMLFDTLQFARYENDVADLCERRLPRACADWFGLLMAKEMGGIGMLMSGKEKKPTKENPQIMALTQKIIDMGDAEGYTYRAIYLQLLGRKKESAQDFEKAIALGSQKATLAQMNIALGEVLKEPEKKKPKKKKKNK